MRELFGAMPGDETAHASGCSETKAPGGNWVLTGHEAPRGEHVRRDDHHQLPAQPQQENAVLVRVDELRVR
jgi:hypothetical protein